MVEIRNTYILLKNYHFKTSNSDPKNYFSVSQLKRDEVHFTGHNVSEDEYFQKLLEEAKSFISNNQKDQAIAILEPYREIAIESKEMLDKAESSISLYPYESIYFKVLRLVKKKYKQESKLLERAISGKEKDSEKINRLFPSMRNKSYDEIMKGKPEELRKRLAEWQDKRTRYYIDLCVHSAALKNTFKALDPENNESKDIIETLAIIFHRIYD